MNRKSKFYHKADFAPHIEKIINSVRATSAKDTKITKV